MSGVGVEFDPETLHKKYQGEFKNDFYNGRGILYGKDG